MFATLNPHTDNPAGFLCDLSKLLHADLISVDWDGNVGAKIPMNMTRGCYRVLCMLALHTDENNPLTTEELTPYTKYTRNVTGRNLRRIFLSLTQVCATTGVGSKAYWFDPNIEPNYDDAEIRDRVRLLEFMWKSSRWGVSLFDVRDAVLVSKSKFVLQQLLALNLISEEEGTYTLSNDLLNGSLRDAVRTVAGCTYQYYLAE